MAGFSNMKGNFISEEEHEELSDTGGANCVHPHREYDSVQHSFLFESN
jgi:hypothetical protein